MELWNCKKKQEKSIVITNFIVFLFLKIYGTGNGTGEKYGTHYKKKWHKNCKTLKKVLKYWG